MNAKQEAEEWAARLPVAELSSLYWSTLVKVPHEQRTERERAVVERLFHPPPTEKRQQCSKPQGERWFR
jgi:hypothetical protein